MPTLKIAKNFTPDAVQYASQGNAILGIRDSGKSYTAMKSGEEMMDAGIPIVVFDPVGIWKYLKVGVDGNKGYPIVVAGGDQPDIPLTVENAPKIVRAAMEQNVSLVLDLYSVELANKSTWIKIVAECVRVLLYENKTHNLRHLFFEEAAEFIPQRLGPQHAKVYAEIEKLARIGRNARLGYTIINQRAEEINKAILEISECSFVHKQVGKNSLISLQKWFEVSGLWQKLNKAAIVEKHFKDFKDLQQGESIAVFSGEYKLIKCLKKKTFHPDPKKDKQSLDFKKASTDVSGFVKKLKAGLEAGGVKLDSAKLPDIAAAGARGAAAGAALRMEHENKRLRELAEEQKKQLTAYKTFAARLITASDQLKKVNEYLSSIKDDLGNLAESASMPKTPSSLNSVRGVAYSGSPSNGTPKSGAMRILQASARAQNMTREKVALLAGLSHNSGSFGTYVSKLKTEGLLQVSGNVFSITDKGRQVVGDVSPLPTSAQELCEMWCENLGSNGGAARMLRALMAAHQVGLSKERLGVETGLSSESGSFGTYMSRLKSLGLINKRGDRIIASDDFFY